MVESRIRGFDLTRKSEADERERLERVAELAHYMKVSSKVPGWTRGEEAAALARAAFDAPDDAVIVEIGSFFGGGSILLAGARKLRGSGRVHCVDPFDASGDAVSTPHYDAILTAFGGLPLKSWFDENIRDAGLSDWVEVHQDSAAAAAKGWARGIDLLFVDGDQSPRGARTAYEAWSPWLKTGGVIALHNSNPREYEPGHEGHFLLAQRELKPPHYVDVQIVGSGTFARKATRSVG
jgi:MMP 1-O-methyltransferase